MCKLNCRFNGIYRFRTSWSAASEQLRAAKLVRTAMYSRVMVLSAPIRWPSVYVVHAVNWMHVKWADKRGMFTVRQRTTLAALATTSRSLGTAAIVAPTEAMREGEIRATSRRHSVARARNIANVMSRELPDGSTECSRKGANARTLVCEGFRTGLFCFRV